MIFDKSNNYIHALAARFGKTFTKAKEVSIAFMYNTTSEGTNRVAAGTQRQLLAANDISFNHVVVGAPASFTLGYWQLFYDNSGGSNPFTITGDYIALEGSHWLIGEGATIEGITAETDLIPLSDLKLFWVGYVEEQPYVIPCDKKCYFGDVAVSNLNNDNGANILLLLVKPDGTFEMTGNFRDSVTQVLFSHIEDGYGAAYGCDFNGIELDFIPDGLAALGDTPDPITFTPFYLTTEEEDFLTTEEGDLITTG